MKYKVFIILLTSVISSCATTYVPDNFYVYQGKHEVIAIIPFDVVITSKNQGKGVTPEDLKTEAKSFSKVLQNEVYTQFLQRTSKDKYTVSFQDVSDTNVILNRNGAIDDSGKVTLTKKELAALLKVDAILTGSLVLSKPMSGGAAVATSLLFGYGVTNEVTANISIHDGESGELVWNYDHEMQGGLLSSPVSVAESLMDNVAWEFPYKKK